jgi:hypothetical protein
MMHMIRPEMDKAAVQRVAVQLPRARRTTRQQKSDDLARSGRLERGVGLHGLMVDGQAL